MTQSELDNSISTHSGFAHSRLRGFRAPNHYSAKSPEEVKNLGAWEAITVHNARQLDPPPTLDTHGFQLVSAPTSLNLLDTDVVREKFYDECREVIKQVRGCGEVRGGSHEYRNGFGGQSGERGVKPTPNGSGGSYATAIHADMSSWVEEGMRQVVPDERHFECINLWRSANGESVEMRPLVLCDMRSVEVDDIVFGDGMNTGNIKQYTKLVDQRIIHGPHQRWYYYPNMTCDEMLMFRQYDTRQELLNMRTTFHTSVEDPTTAPDAPMRYTIEVRMQAIYEKETNKAERVARYTSQISNKYADGRISDWWSGPVENDVPPAD